MSNKRLFFSLFMLAVAICASAYSVTVDRHGVMRRSDTGAEVSFYGANYTVPFAHAYRALGYLGIDRKEAIDRDVYHFARLGLNAFRIHLWDAEISDAQGNLIDNDHLDLLDYLIYKMEERGISVIITAQTNFGNGYPERNIDTGAFTYDFDKCQIHDNPEAIAIQERYVKALVEHRNRYNGKTYAADEMIIAIEINNEPCHSGDAEAAKRYINRMVKAIKAGGFKKPIFYNVSHNPQCIPGYYDASIQGTTYQWYPLGLVAGYQRSGNYLPYVEHYNIPFNTVKGFDRVARMIYEFDPADNLYTFLYPAAVRAFRSAGFQWMTQFTYDPTDMAWSNTEYQTHFLNLAYTPGKAIGMKIAGRVAQEVERGADFGAYPNDTIFGNFSVSYDQNLSEYITDQRFFYTNNTITNPHNPEALTEIAGVGTSPVVSYAGTGAYFLDRLDESTWRLEVMPDVFLTCDPFEKPSLDRRVGEIVYCDEPITINLPSLGKEFSYRAVNDGNSRTGRASNGTFSVYPGVYLLTTAPTTAWTASSPFGGTMRVGEYVAPAKQPVPLTVVHTPQSTVMQGDELCISATVIGDEPIDSVLVYPTSISFWNAHNTLYKMERGAATHQYQVKIKIDENRDYRYNLVAFAGGKAVTFPQNAQGTPLDWDYRGSEAYAVTVCSPGTPVVLVRPSSEWRNMEVTSIPDTIRYSFNYSAQAPVARDCYKLWLKPSTSTDEVIVSKYVGDVIAPIADDLAGRKLHVALATSDNSANIEIAVVTRLGATYSCPAKIVGGVAIADIADMRLTDTRIAPQPFPMFLDRRVAVAGPATIGIADVEKVGIIVSGAAPGQECRVELGGIWLQ